jgi:hypothetical protein
LTLIELLIASTMIAILFVGLGAHLRGGITVWRRATGEIEKLQRRRAALDRLSQELASAFVCTAGEGQDGGGGDAPPLPAAEFSAQRLAWFASVPSGGTRTVRFLQYACGTVEDTTALWRTSLPVAVARDGSAVTAEPALEGCANLSARYAYLASAQGSAVPLEWRPVWIEADKLPRLVEISLALEDETLRRIVVVPAGVLKAYEPQAQAP